MNGILGLLDPYYRAIAGAPSPVEGLQGSLLSLLPMAAEQSSGSWDPNASRWEQVAARRAQNRYGWGPNEFDYIDRIISQESGWNPNAVNGSSGAYGIPQILPAAHPNDLGLGPSQQVNWLLNYISQRYGTPAEAYQHKASTGWY